MTADVCPLLTQPHAQQPFHNDLHVSDLANFPSGESKDFEFSNLDATVEVLLCCSFLISPLAAILPLVIETPSLFR